MSQFIKLGIVVSLLTSLAGCKRADVSDAVNQTRQTSGCLSVTESVYVNTRYPDHIDPYYPDSARVLNFEEYFEDTVSVFVGNRLVAKQFMQTKSNGLAKSLRVKARANEELRITLGQNGCASFRLKDGYQYLYVTRSEGRGWAIAYSNYSRGYF